MRRISPARISQYLFLALFLLLFLQTEYRGNDRIAAAVNGFFRADPLVAVSCLLAEKAFTWLIAPGLLLLGLSLLLGRFFCGWVCPLGTILDLVTPKIRKTKLLAFPGENLKYLLLIPLLTCSLFDLNLSGLLDPLALLLRALSFFFHPLLGDSFRQAWVALYRVMGERRDLLAPGYAVLRDHILPFRETFYPLAFLSALLLLLIVVLERHGTRTWCRTLCPLGTLIGLAGRFSPFGRIPERLCPDCGACREICPTSFQGDALRGDECILCMECRLHCPSQRVRFSLSRFPGPTPYLPERRIVLGGMFSGFFLARFFRFRSPEAGARLLRPPGVLNEAELLKRCVRCGECMKVCLKSALYPALLQAGVEGLYTPVVIPRLGYCEYNCTLCGQVCPTGAIPQLELVEKRRAVMGKAVFDRNHCLPFAKRMDCIVCEEHCPVPAKAIRSRKVAVISPAGRRVTIQEPYVVDELCIGCGICEHVCPLEGKAGIEVFSVKDRTPLMEPDPTVPPGSGSDPYGQGNRS
jgi:ferredoxin